MLFQKVTRNIFEISGTSGSKRSETVLMDDFIPITVHLESPSGVTLLSWIVSDCDNTGYVTTENSGEGIVSLYCLPQTIPQYEALLSALREEVFPIVSWGMQ